MTAAAPSPPAAATASSWRLLLAGLTAVDTARPAGAPPPTDALADGVALGGAVAALASAAAAELTRPPGWQTWLTGAGCEAETGEAATAYWSAVADAAVRAPAAPADRLAVGAAALLIFVQANFTGPPPNVPDSPAALVGGQAAPLAPTPSLPLGADTTTPTAAAALAALTASGEDADAATALPAYGALAVECLLRPLGLAGDGCALDATALARLPPTWPAWALRASAARQRVLASPAAASREAVKGLGAAAAEAAATAPPWARRRAVAGAALEAAAAALDARDVGAAYLWLDAAAAALGVAVSTTGALGVRTEHQAEAKAQLVVSIVSVGDGADDGADSGDDAEALAAAAAGGHRGGPDMAGVARSGDVLPAPRLSAGAPQSRSPSPMLQALLLLRGAAVERGSADDGLRGWRAAPFVDAARAAPRTYPALTAAAAVAAARHERDRSRTRERSLVALEAVRDAAAAPEPPASSRRPLALAAPLPPLHRVARAAADALLAAGMVAAALDAYVGVEAWDAVALCYRLLGKAAAARDVVERRLALRPTDARLLCAMGDITGDESHYYAALEAAGGRSARARRALAARAGRRGDWADAAAHWDAALALNPVHADGWFALGYARLKQGEDASAAAAFSRCACEDRDHGDAWNNLAALHLRGGRPAAAFLALQQATRLKRESWQTWQNFASAALASRAPVAAARGLTMVLELTRGEQRPLDLLRGLAEAAASGRACVEAAEAAKERAPADASAETATVDESDIVLDWGDDGDGEGEHDASPPPIDLDVSVDAVAEPMATRRDLATLEAAVGAALRSATAGPGAADAGVWAALAAFYSATGAATAAREARLKRFRSLSGSRWRDSGDAYAAYAAAAADLGTAEADAAAARAAGGPDTPPSTAGGGVPELAAARMALATAVAVGKDAFGGSAALAAAEAALVRVDAALAAAKEKKADEATAGA